MKIKLDIDCTPEEARRFFGLPDLQPMQEALMAETEARLLAALAAMEPEALLKAWLPMGAQGWEEMQKAMWGQFGKSAGRPK